MAATLQSVTIEDKARELCEFVLEQDDYQEAWKQIEKFLENEPAKMRYRAWQETGAELHHQEQQGMAPSEDHVAELERLKQTVLDDPVAVRFLEAEGQMNQMFSTVTKLLQKTLQMGRVPSAEEMAEGECCGNSGCGCH